MVHIPEQLVSAIATGDCVLWTGAGIGTLAGRPDWTELLVHLLPDAGRDAEAPLADLLEQGRLRTVLSYVHRHAGDEPLARLMTQLATDHPVGELPGDVATFAGLPWRAAFSTVYPDVMQALLESGGKRASIVSHTDTHDVNLRGSADPFILRTPPTVRSLRADAVFFDLVEEAVRSRTMLFVGFNVDDPDLFQILDLLGRVGRGRRHYAWMAGLTEAEAEEILERYGIEVLQPEGDRAELEALSAALGAAAQGDDAGRANLSPDTHGATLDLARFLRGIDARADVGHDHALTLDVGALEPLLAAAMEETAAGLEASVLLRAGSVFVAHGRTEPARRCFQTVVDQGARPALERTARFNLGLVAALTGDRSAAVQAFASCADEDRGLALVPPLLELVDLVSRDGIQMGLACRDRETGDDLDVVVAGLGRPIGSREQGLFRAEVERLRQLGVAGVPGVAVVRGAVVDSRLFGILTSPVRGTSLQDTLAAEGALGLDRAMELLGPVFDALAACHERGVVHRNVNVREIVITEQGPVLRGFGVLPVFSYHRACVRRTNEGYAAPEVLAGREATPAADVYGLAATLYRCLAGTPLAGGAPPVSSLQPGLDPRIDEVLARALHPDPQHRPDLQSLRAELEAVLTEPSTQPFSLVDPPQEAPVAAAPVDEQPMAASGTSPGPEPSAVSTGDAGGAALSAPATERIQIPEDPDDLEAWAWILERKPGHMEAREAIERIEQEARDQGRWDRVGDVIMVRAQHTQVQQERVELLRELSGIFENQLQAPANAFMTLQAVLDELPVPAQIDLVDELVRLADASGSWAELADTVQAVAERAPDPGRQGQMYLMLAKLYAEQLGAADQAAGAYERAMTMLPDAREPLDGVIPVYRRLGRFAELGSALLRRADLGSGADRHDDLVAAASVIAEHQGDVEGAFAAVEAVRKDAPDHEGALELVVGFARTLERFDVLAEALLQQSRASFDDAVAIELGAEAAELLVEHGNELRRAAAVYAELLGRDRGRRDLARRQVELLRQIAAEDPSQRGSLLDALTTLAESEDPGPARGKLLAACAELLDAQEGQEGRAAEYREQILETLVPSDPVAVAAVRSLDAYYVQRQDPGARVALYRRQSAPGHEDEALRTEAFRRLVELARGEAADEVLLREALEALCERAPEESRWRDALIENLLDAGEIERARPMLDAQVEVETDPLRKAGLLVHVARLQADDDPTGAIGVLNEALSLDPACGRAWQALYELYAQTGQPLKALEAQVEAARNTESPVERARMLLQAARDCVDRLGEVDRALPLLEEVVRLDPDGTEAAQLLLEKLIERDALERAWPVAQTRVLQLRSNPSATQAARVRVLATAGRCALAVDEPDRAREYLEEARSLNAGNLDVRRLLADLDMAAEQWGDALNNYQSLVLGAGDKLNDADRSDLYRRMARAQLGLGEGRKALQMVDRAVELNPGNERAVELSVELAGSQGTPAQVVKAKRLFADVLGRREARQSGDEAARVRRQRVETLLEVAELQAEGLNLPEEAIQTLERVLGLVPGDPAILHRLLDLFTAHERWRDAVTILERLATGREGATRGKFLYAGAVILRDQLGDLEKAGEWMLKVVEADPLHRKAFRAVMDLLAKKGAWRDLAKAIRGRLKSMPETADPADRLELLTELGRIYEEELDEPVTALAAHEQAVTLAATLPEADTDAITGRRRHVIELGLSLGGEEIDRAIGQAHILVTENPMEFELYHQLVQLYLNRGERDQAVCIAKALRFLKQADEKELALAGEPEDVLPRIGRTMGRELWRQCVYHPLENGRLSDLFSIIWPMVAAREARTHAHYGVKRDDRVQVSLRGSEGLARHVAAACQTMDAPVPDLFLRPDEDGGIRAAAVADVDGGQVRTVYPTLLAGKDATANQVSPTWIFRAARAVAKARPEHILASVLPSGVSLRHTVFGAVSAARPDVAIPEDCREQAISYGNEIRRYLAPARFDQLKNIVTRVTEEGGADTRRWVEGVDYTVTRMAFVMTDSLEHAARVLGSDADDAAVPSKDRLRDLIAYSCSEPYFRLRKELDITRG